jgi:enamine deaminase RidA (YjgF/YER057c/UK114 family)
VRRRCPQALITQCGAFRLSVLAAAQHLITRGYTRDLLADLVHHAGGVVSQVTRTGHRLAAGQGPGERHPVDRVHAGRPHSDPDLPRARVRSRSICPLQDLGTPVSRELQRSHPPLLHTGGSAPAPGAGQYSRAGTGQLVAVSGQVATGENGQFVGPGDPSVQARQVFENLRRCLAAAGLSFGEVIKLTYYLTDMAHLPKERDYLRRSLMRAG